MASGALVGVVESRTLEDDARGTEDLVGDAAALRTSHLRVLAHGVLDLEDDVALGALVVIAGHFNPPGTFKDFFQWHSLP